jgi:hypothetical protein
MNFYTILTIIKSDIIKYELIFFFFFFKFKIGFNFFLILNKSKFIRIKLEKKIYFLKIFFFLKLQKINNFNKFLHI